MAGMTTEGPAPILNEGYTSYEPLKMVRVCYLIKSNFPLGEKAAEVTELGSLLNVSF